MLKIIKSKSDVQANSLFDQYFKFVPDTPDPAKSKSSVLVLDPNRLKSECAAHKDSLIIGFSPDKVVSGNNLKYSEEQSGSNTVLTFDFDLSKSLEYFHTSYQSEKDSFNTFIDDIKQVIAEIFSKYGTGIRPAYFRPQGGKFFMYLTHDVDFAFIDRYLFTPGFVNLFYKSIRTFFNREKRSSAVKFYKQFFKYLAGKGTDPWNSFESYWEIEKQRKMCSTFYLIPTAEVNGPAPKLTDNTAKPSYRKPRYRILDLKEFIENSWDSDFSIGVHGINSWHSLNESQKEMDLARQSAGQHFYETMRVHWLYFDENTPDLLFKTGYSIDSTLGYNRTVGFKTSSTQPFFFSGTKLMELPLTLMDSALFYHLQHTKEEFNRIVDSLIEKFKAAGGVLTVNWHDRSLGFDRGWAIYYVKLLEKIQTAGGVVSSPGEIYDSYSAYIGRGYDPMHVFVEEI